MILSKKNLVAKCLISVSCIIFWMIIFIPHANIIDCQCVEPGVADLQVNYGYLIPYMRHSTSVVNNSNTYVEQTSGKGDTVGFSFVWSGFFVRILIIAANLLLIYSSGFIYFSRFTLISVLVFILMFPWPTVQADDPALYQDDNANKVIIVFNYGLIFTYHTKAAVVLKSEVSGAFEFKRWLPVVSKN